MWQDTGHLFLCSEEQALLLGSSQVQLFRQTGEVRATLSAWAGHVSLCCRSHGQDGTSKPQGEAQVESWHGTARADLSAPGSLGPGT